MLTPGTAITPAALPAEYPYDKIYDALATLACSNMTRFGVHGILTPEKVAHIVAYLIDPASPVNR